MFYHVIMIIVIIVLMSIFHVCIGWTFSCQRLPSIFVFSWVLEEVHLKELKVDYIPHAFVVLCYMEVRLSQLKMKM